MDNTGILTWLETIFTECWNIWNIRFNFGDNISFSLAQVAAVVVFIWIVSLAIGTLLDDDWGA